MRHRLRVLVKASIAFRSRKRWYSSVDRFSAYSSCLLPPLFTSFSRSPNEHSPDCHYSSWLNGVFRTTCRKLIISLSKCRPVISVHRCLDNEWVNVITGVIADGTGLGTRRLCHWSRAPAPMSSSDASVGYACHNAHAASGEREALFHFLPSVVIDNLPIVN